MCIFCAAFCLFSFVVVCVACMERERELVEIERACIKGGVTCVFCFFVVVVVEVGWMVGLLLCMEREREDEGECVIEKIFCFLQFLLLLLLLWFLVGGSDFVDDDGVRAYH